PIGSVFRGSAPPSPASGPLRRSLPAPVPPPAPRLPFALASPFLQLPLYDPRPLPRLKFLVGMRSLADREKLLVCLQGRLELLHFIQDNGTEKPDPRSIFAEFPRLVEGRQRLGIRAGQVQHISEFDPGARIRRLELRSLLKLDRRRPVLFAI